MEHNIRKPCLLAVSGLTAVLAAGFFINIPQAAKQDGISYGLHSSAVYLDAGEGEKPLYEHQWALKNNGQIRLVDRTGGNVLMSGPAAVGGLDADETVRQVTNALPGIDIQAEAAWNVYEQTQNRKPVIVALIDTGVDVTHPDLAGGIWINEDEIPGDGIDNDRNGYIDDVYGWNFSGRSNLLYSGPEDDHGTHAAGTIIGNWDGKGITGIADSTYVKVMVLKALGADGKGDSSDVIEAVRYAQANGASICNLSFGADTYDSRLDSLIRNSGMLFVISAGNGNSAGIGFDIDQSPVYPAAFTCDNIISVGNLMFDGSLHESSNYGSAGVDIAAPGSYILSTTAGNGYGYMSGTSMAAPMVTGAAALTASCRSDLDLMGIKNALLGSAVWLEGLNGKVKTSGMLNVYGALTYQTAVQTALP